MKLKLIVASMSVLGLVSTSAFAVDAPAKHKNHHIKKHHVAASQVDYKAMGALPVVDTCSVSTQYSNVLDTMDQTLGRAKPSEDCNKLITFAGGMNLDAHWGNRNINYQGRNNQRMSLNDAYLNIFGNVNQYVKAFATLSYGDPTERSQNLSFVLAAPSAGKVKPFGEYSGVYTANGENKVTLEQGFIRISNFDAYPYFIQLGKQFTDFGRYKIHAITRSVTQSLSETLATTAELGFVLPTGFHGDVYAFDNPVAPYEKGLKGHSKVNYGASVGYDMQDDKLGYDLNLGYLYNITGVNDVAHLYDAYVANRGYDTRVGAIALDAIVKSGPFSLIGDYVLATTRFSKLDIKNHLGGSVGAQPWAGNLQAGYNFNGLNRNQNVYLGYQVTEEAVFFNLPKSRWTAGWNVDLWKNTNLGFEFGHDVDYSAGDGGTGEASNTLAVRAAVKFG